MVENMKELMKMIKNMDLAFIHLKKLRIKIINNKNNKILIIKAMLVIKVI